MEKGYNNEKRGCHGPAARPLSLNLDFFNPQIGKRQTALGHVAHNENHHKCESAN
jgi:hypothetical protein